MTGNIVKLLNVGGYCDYELINGDYLSCSIKKGIKPLSECTEKELDKIIDWSGFIQITRGYNTYCCEPPPSSIKEFRLLLKDKDDRVWKTSGLDYGNDSDSD
jgi:hypothetical protein